MVFVDSENISKQLFNDFYTSHQEETYKVYGHTGSFSDCYFKCGHVGFINCCYGKNSADTFMVADIVKSIYTEDIGHYYIISHDRDLAIAIKMLTDNKKYVTLVTNIDSEMSNLQDLDVDFSYLDYEQHGKGANYNNNNLIKIGLTHNTEIQYKECTDRVWVRLNKNRIIECPFKHGVPVTTMKKFLAPYRKKLGIGSIKSWTDVLEENFIKVCDNKAYFYTEEELYAL